MKEKICIIGSSSSVSKEFVKLLDKREATIVTVGRSKNDDVFLDINYNNYDQVNLIPMDCDRYLITLGYLLSKKITDQTTDETLNSIAINLLFPVKLIEEIFEVNSKARIIILGSESGFKGSYDTSYFIAKAGISSYVREKHIKFPEQQLVMVAPSVILDTKMTQQRDDLDKVLDRALSLPKKRYLLSKEVAESLYFLFFIDQGYINNEVINMNGGKFARMNYGD
jgi:short-subunit dehydrogenase